MQTGQPAAGDEALPERVCIIGAGSSGVTVAKALKQRGVAFDCFEAGSDIGGMWRYENDNGASSAYSSLHIDTSRRNLGYADFPIPEHLPDFLSHRQFLAYLESYADAFGIRPLVTFRTKVEDVRPDGGGWAVRLSNGETRRYRAVIVASGHLWDPRWPTFAGAFDGQVAHSHHYRVPQPYQGQDVLVVGLGNSAVDIAVDLCRTARHVTLSTRRGAWIMPKYLMGRPVDQWSGFLARRLKLPTRVTRMIMARLIRLAQGDQRRFGLKRPDHPMWREHATLSQDLLPAIGHGRISVKPNISRLDGSEVVFEDTSRARFDAIVYATGYRTTFPFLDAGVFDADGQAGLLYRRMLALEQPGLYFAGLVQPVGPTIPLVEIQGQWLAAVLAGAVALPSPRVQWQEVEAHRERQRATYVGSERYALEVDFRSYARALRADMAAGQAG